MLVEEQQWLVEVPEELTQVSQHVQILNKIIIVSVGGSVMDSEGEELIKAQ